MYCKEKRYLDALAGLRDLRLLLRVKDGAVIGGVSGLE